MGIQRRELLGKLAGFGALSAWVSSSASAQTGLSWRYIKNPNAHARAYSILLRLTHG
jgi:hypothetical protein